MSTPPTLRVTESDLRFLSAGWLALTGAQGAGAGAADRWLGILTRSYSAPGRHYHNLHHVAEMLRLLAHFQADAEDYTAVRFAAWFHDAVYDTRGRTNEEESAALAERALAELRVPPERIEAVRLLILATQRHEAAGDAPDLGLFLDADLSILGAEEETYLAYREAVRMEYSWVPDAAYREGRLKVLKKFLGRERLYFTDALAARFEARGRINLASEILALTSEEGIG